MEGVASKKDSNWLINGLEASFILINERVMKLLSLSKNERFIVPS